MARIARLGQSAAAAKEIAVARWLGSEGVAAVEVLEGVSQPVVVEGPAVTFWRELPEHRHGTLQEIASVLKQLHTCELPSDVQLPKLAPFRASGGANRECGDAER
jgi:hypothetical protein